VFKKEHCALPVFDILLGIFSENTYRA